MKKDFFKNKYSKIFAKKIHFLKRSIFKKNWIAYHGLERSGSNFLCACLVEINLKIINLYTKPHKTSTNLQHKHFRWYQNKNLIPDFRKRFKNDVHVKDIFELNKLCNYPLDTSHIVIKKSHDEAIASILNHGIRMNWFSNRDSAIKSINSIKNDYVSYYEFWEDQSMKFPEMVQVVKYEELQESSKPLSKALKKLKLEVKKIPIKFSFDRVEQSKKNRQVFFHAKDINIFH